MEGGSTDKGMDGVAADFRRRKVFPNDLLDIPTYLTIYKRHLSVYPNLLYAFISCKDFGKGSVKSIFK